MEKNIFFDFDDTILEFDNYLWNDINSYFIKEEIYFEISKGNFHKSKDLINRFVSLNYEKNSVFIDNFFKELNSYFNLELNDINIDNMSRRWQKIRKYFSENNDIEDKLVSYINNCFIDNKVFKKVDLNSIKYMEEELRSFYKNEYGYYKNGKFVNGSIECLKILKENGFKISIVTSSMSKEQEIWKENFIKKHLNGLYTEIIHTNNKYKYSKNGILIDDKEKHVIKHIENNNLPGILFRNKSNIENDLLLQIDNFEQLLEFFNIENNSLSTSKKP